jgi:hypothetical protein
MFEVNLPHVVSFITDKSARYLTCAVDEPGEGSVELRVDAHVVVLTLRLDVCVNKIINK